jgi:hypothetical protein
MNALLWVKSLRGHTLHKSARSACLSPILLQLGAVVSYHFLSFYPSFLHYLSLFIFLIFISFIYLGGYYTFYLKTKSKFANTNTKNQDPALACVGVSTAVTGLTWPGGD